ncbi:uncharacterized protein LOC111806841 isoform X1 [Cucurbita pepo subsp. pepo]|uniref:uncharacterized protein LOC111806841 isoform X1 n=2 Tax=Cucurbita pepo subsp. pepo TaxID=3664 RepID=UPI000C9D5781|nr:uncharacterized protein LOC111806841 isoform X1 [Cucurbita pepo subsp. pepo]
MSGEEPPKLYANKPKKAQVKQFQEQHKVMSASSSSSPAPPASSNTAATSSSSSSSLPQPPKESFARRYKFLWPMLLTVNLAVGAYLFMRTKKQDEQVTEEEAAPDSAKTAKIAAPVVEESFAKPAIVEPVKVREPIPVDQQRELFKWILEEKRKIKPKDREEKKRIDEEKAILKEFIRAKSIPNL